MKNNTGTNFLFEGEKFVVYERFLMLPRSGQGTKTKFASKFIVRRMGWKVSEWRGKLKKEWTRCTKLKIHRDILM